MIELIALSIAAIVVAEKLRLCHHGCETVPQIVADRVSHAADGCKPLGFDQPALRFLQAGSHAKEGSGDFWHLVASARDQRICIVSLTEGTDTFHQGAKRTCERVREDENHATA